MNSILRIAAVAVLGFGFAGSALAAGPRVVGTGDNASVEYDMPSANIVGGALVRVVGTGNDASTEATYIQAAQAPRLVRVTQDGQNSTTTVLREFSPLNMAMLLDLFGRRG
jgi:hypothetical protein